MITRNDFELIAGVMHHERCHLELSGIKEPTESVYGFEIAVNALADYFEASNSRFQRKRFLDACGIQRNTKDPD